MSSAPVQKNLLNFSAQAEREVTQDSLTVTYSVTKEAPTAGEVHNALATAQNAALKIAKAKEVAGKVDVVTGSFSIYPKYTDKGKITGYTGSAELTVSGTDITTITDLTSAITSMEISSTDQSVSKKLRLETETMLMQDLVDEFRAKGEKLAALFKFKGYTLVSANVQIGGGFGGPIRAMSMAKAGGAAPQEAIAVSPGKEAITASIDGQIQLK